MCVCVCVRVPCAQSEEAVLCVCLLVGAEFYQPTGGSVQVSGLSVCQGWLSVGVGLSEAVSGGGCPSVTGIVYARAGCVSEGGCV